MYFLQAGLLYHYDAALNEFFTKEHKPKNIVQESFFKNLWQLTGIGFSRKTESSPLDAIGRARETSFRTEYLLSRGSTDS